MEWVVQRYSKFLWEIQGWYTKYMQNPFLIFVDGPMGAGKTTTTKQLNTELPYTARIAFPEIKRLIPSYRESEKTIPIIKDVMSAMIDKYLEHDVSVIVEQIAKQDGIERIKQIADKYDARFLAYRLNASKEIRWERVKERTRQMMDVEQLPESKIEELKEYFEPNDRFYEENPSHISVRIDSQVNEPTDITKIIKADLR